MKKTLSIFLVLLAVGTLHARNSDRPVPSSNAAIMKQGSTFKVFYKGSKPVNVKVSIFDADHKLVFTETIRKIDGFARPYNFSNLPEGNYSIEVSDGHLREQEIVAYTTVHKKFEVIK